MHTSEALAIAWKPVELVNEEQVRRVADRVDCLDRSRRGRQIVKDRRQDNYLDFTICSVVCYVGMLGSRIGMQV